MANIIALSSSLLANFFAVFLFLVLINSSTSLAFNPKQLLYNYNVSKLAEADSDWSPAQATWYGSPTGAGTDGKFMDSTLILLSIL